VTLEEFFATKPRGAKSEMAEAIGVSRTWMALLVAGSQVPSPELAVEIEKYTNGAVTRVELRPDIFGVLK
jgi:DNA-binding transcriptional regulator YdaS (Cro superfamily)